MARRPRSTQIDLHHATCYHVVSRCVRKLFLLASPTGNRDAATNPVGVATRHQRKSILLKELRRLATHTAVGVAGFAVMDNHLHLLLKVDTDAAAVWPPHEVARRWLALHPPRDGRYKPLPVKPEHITALANDADAVAAARTKLTSISQFMKEFKQTATQRLNALDDTTGPLWAGRFKCKAVTSEAQLLTTLAYIDLNPFAAGACDTPESSEHTSLAARLHGDTHSPAPPDAPVNHNIDTEAEAPERVGWWMPLGPARHAQRLLPATDLTLTTYRRLLSRTAELLRARHRPTHASTPAHQATPQPQSQPSAIERLPVTPAALAETLHAWRTRGLLWAGIDPIP